MLMRVRAQNALGVRVVLGSYSKEALVSLSIVTPQSPDKINLVPQSYRDVDLSTTHFVRLRRVSEFA